MILAGFTPLIYLFPLHPPVSLLSPPALFFGILAVLSALITMNYRGLLRGSIDRQVNTAFVFPLLFLVEPTTVIVILWSVALADGVLHPRKPLSVFYNMGQLSLAAGSAVAVLRLGKVPVPFTQDPSPSHLPAVFLALLTFTLLNEILTQTIACLAGRRKFSLAAGISRSAALTELLCVCFGVGLLLLWTARPWYAAAGAAAPFMVMFLIIELARREQQVEREHAALGSLQELGLEIGAELESDRLYQTLVRAASEGIKVGGAILGVARRPSEPCRVVSACGVFSESAPDTLCPHCAERMAFPHSTSILLDPRNPPHPEKCEFTKVNAVEFVLTPLNSSGGLPALLAVGRGEERRRFTGYDLQAMDTLRGFADMALANSHLLSEMREMHERLTQSEKMSALGTLVSGVAHELNNPLTTVIGYAEMLQRQEQESSRRTMLEAVVREGRRSARIVNNLLTFSRKRKPNKEATNLNVLVRQILELRAVELTHNEIQVENRLASGLPPVLADPNQIQQVIMNLMINAEHAVADIASDRWIRIRSYCRDDRVVLEVQDNGPGISEENAADIFLPFYTTKEVGRGTGLGLSICYGIITEHKGEIRHQSPDEGGARFAISLPVLHADAPRKKPDREASPRTEAGGRILVVDDEPAVAEMVHAVLDEAGWKVSSTVSATDALNLIGTETYDIILTDVVMPGMNGMEFYEALGFRRPELLPHVVFITGDSVRRQTMDFLENVRNDYLLKPFEEMELLSTLSRVSGRLQASRQ